MSYSTELVKLLFSQSLAASFNALADITFKDYSTGVTQVVYICNNDVPITFGGHTYQPFGFNFDPPDSKDGGVGDARIVISAVDQEIPSLILSVFDPPTFVVHTLVSKVTGTAESIEQWSFKMKNVSWNASSVQADLTFESYLDRAIPAVSIDMTNFAGSF